ncbi:MAG: hypothetical protein KDK99_09010 [Verrucomicrobiales bacterium]|nr:hypothetical protein [Verrucomicrobiales bacterium]
MSLAHPLRHVSCATLRVGGLGLFIALLPPPSISAQSIDVASDRQLFLDDALLDLNLSHNLHRQLNPPTQIERVLKPERPSEALGFIFYGSVVDDGGVIRLFHGSYDADKKKHFSLATSRDGRHFERPDLGLTEYRGDRHNNILPVEAVEAGVFLDPHASAEKRYRLLYTRHWPDPASAGVYVASSPDGIHWQQSERRVFPFAPDSQHAGFWDPRLQRYVIFLRAWDPLRSIARLETPDLDTPWPYDATVPPRHIWGPEKIPTPSRELPVVMAPTAEDPPNFQLYTSAAIRYPFAAQAYLAFPAAYWLFQGDAWKSRALNGNDGTFDIHFASSRDGVTWQRWPTPYLTAGRHDGQDLRLVSLCMGLVRRGDELYQYFIGWPHTHGRPVVWDKDLEDRAQWLKKDLGGIYRATQRLDGFVSLDAQTEPSVITTHPLRFIGDRLQLNLHTDAGGWARVTMLEADGTEIPGFGISDAVLLNTDAVNQEVTWQNGADLSSLEDHPVRLQITLCRAKLFAFQFLPPTSR